MKKQILIFFLLLTSLISFGENLEVRGIYIGYNLYVRNPFSLSTKEFCIYKVMVNGQISKDEINSSAFEINFTNYNLEIGDEVNITLSYRNNCTPEIINPEAIKPRSTFSIISARVDVKGILHWVTTEESGSIPFIIEQFRWNKWIKLGEVDGKGRVSPTSYKFETKPHSGENKFRVKQVDYTEKPHYSSPIYYTSALLPVTFSLSKTQIAFSSPTLYELYNAYGILIIKDFGKAINLSGYEKGEYYLNFDNQMSTFSVK